MDCRGAFCRTRGIPHWGCDWRCTRQTHTCHQPHRSIPPCGLRGLWAPLRSETADSRDQPGESGPWGLEATRTPLKTRKNNHDAHSTKNWVGQLAVIYPNSWFSSFLTSSSSSRWAEMHFSRETKPTQSQPQKFMYSKLAFFWHSADFQLTQLSVQIQCLDSDCAELQDPKGQAHREAFGWWSDDKRLWLDDPAKDKYHKSEGCHTIKKQRIVDVQVDAIRT